MEKEEMFSEAFKLEITRIFLWTVTVLSFFWWPLSHWLYPAWYHSLLGFDGFEDMYVKAIGTLALIPVLIMFFCAKNPVKNRAGVKILIVSGVAMAFTYVYLIQQGLFPELEYTNAGLTLFLGRSQLVMGDQTGFDLGFDEEALDPQRGIGHAPNVRCAVVAHPLPVDGIDCDFMPFSRLLPDEASGAARS